MTNAGKGSCRDARLPSAGSISSPPSTVHRPPRSPSVASVTLHVIKAKAKKTVLPVREKWDRHKEPVSPYFRFSSSRERSERLDSALSRSNGLSGERVHDLERSTVNHVLKRRAELLVYS